MYFQVQYGVIITPVIGILLNKDAFTPILNPNEVEELFDVPLEMFLKVLLKFQFSLTIMCALT